MVKIGARVAGAGGAVLIAGVIASFGGTAGAATQQVFLDFDSQTTGGERVYTAGERAAILANIANDYSGFDFSFSLSAPAGPFTTLFFNSGGAGGLADEIDFRNLNLSSFAQININGILAPAAPSADWIGLTSTIGAHELGHTVGLRHADSYGPIGKGITSPNPGAGPYNPNFPGPTNLAIETGRRIMASPASTGQTLPQAIGDTYFGEREVAKLKFNETGTVVNEQAGAHNSILNAQPLALGDLGFIPNKLKPGDENFGALFDVDAIAVTGLLGSSSELDYYSFSGTAGQLFNFEVMSLTLDRIANSVDTEIRLFDSGGNLVNYHGSTAFNQDEFETFDSTLIDLTLPATGTYFVEVSTDLAASNLTGNYELFFYSFAVPEPASLALLGFAGLFMTRRRARA